MATGNTIRPAHNHGEFIGQLFDDQANGALYNPGADPSATQRLQEQVASWQRAGNTVGMTFGGFDAPFHTKHRGFLLECKMQGVAHYWEMYNGREWEGLTTEAQNKATREILAERVVNLVVSCDGDARIGASKGGKAAKGGSPRPLQGWETRARNLAGFAVPVTPGGLAVPVVDAVTMHDQIAHPDTPHADPLDLVAYLNPDVWTLFYEAERDIAMARTDKRLAQIGISVISDSGYGYVDPYANSTTQLVQRARQQAGA